MTLKEACANSLLMFVAASCVVLIVKALPQNSQPQQITDNAIERPTGIPTLAMQDGVRVYYMHGKVRCPTCRTIEEYAKEAVETGFAEDLKNKKIAWQVINYEMPGYEHFSTDYNVVAPNVVLVKFKEGKQVAWKGLPEVWEHVGDKVVFVEFVQKSLREFLQNDSATNPPTVPLSKPETSGLQPIPLPSAETSDPQPVAVPLPENPDSQSLPLPTPE